MNALRLRIGAFTAVAIAGALASAGTPDKATSHATAASDTTLATGLTFPPMDAAKGRLLFVSKACVVCHSVNGVGGRNAQPLDARFMDRPMNPFDFAARMWRGAESMVMMQRYELGDVIHLSGQELADIIAFVHDPEEQAKLSNTDIPELTQLMMEHADAEMLGVPHD
ncbi:c-type cytochrome [Roseovarius pelagicus]|uniref:Cytochrome c n=1 Tax=Roseovarius pelagicus TaxID=2980108 RepID=A0ABY6DGJ2_9RHOB|nr:cytochrome c [Roseovarius pelagicus]UXX85251.1 cytochrome c [Roseovarius pelagicus]